MIISFYTNLAGKTSHNQTMGVFQFGGRYIVESRLQPVVASFGPAEA